MANPLPSHLSSRAGEASAEAASAREPSSHGLSQQVSANVLQLLPPGSFVKLRNQPDDLPPFELIRCRGGRCWVRQQAWGSLVQWEVEHRTLTPVPHQAA